MPKTRTAVKTASQQASKPASRQASRDEQTEAERLEFRRRVLDSTIRPEDLGERAPNPGSARLGRNPLDEVPPESVGIDFAREGSDATALVVAARNGLGEVTFRPTWRTLEDQGRARFRALRARLTGEQTFSGALRPSQEAGDALFGELRTVRVSAHLDCPEREGAAAPPPLVARVDADRTRRCSACSHVWHEVELMAARRLEEIGIAVITASELEWRAAMGEVERRSARLGFYGSEPEIPAAAAALEPPSSRLPMYRPR